MQRIFLFALLLVCIHFTKAQTPGWQWAQNGGGSGYAGSTQSNPGWDVISSYDFDSQGNLVIGGYVSWAPRFDTVSYSYVNGNNWNGETMYLVKYNSCGEVVWSTIAGGAGSDLIIGLTIDKNDNIYTVGILQAQGNTVLIRCPAKDSILPTNANTLYNFSKWDKNGNLVYIRTYPYTSNSSWGMYDNQFKMLKDGRILAMLATDGATTNIQGTPVSFNSRYLAIFDTLGNVQKLKLIDSTIITGNALDRIVLDENENIYFTYINLTQPTISILGNNFSPALQYTAYLVKTDTSFVMKKYKTAYYNNALGYLSSDGKQHLYACERNEIGAVFDGDTIVPGGSHANQMQAVVYKIDTNLNMVWVSKSDSQSIGFNSTNIFYGVDEDHLYMGMQNRGGTRWDSIFFTTPMNTFNMAVMRLRTSDGVCDYGDFTQGTINSKDAFTNVAIDQRGNPHFLGNFRDNIGVPGDIEYANTGLTSPDFFILKWGLPCTDTLNSLNTPEAPDALVATAFSSTDINVEWHNNATYRLGFKLYRSPNGLSNWQQIATLPHNVFTYNDGGLTPATPFWYKVTAYTTGGESAFSNIDSATTFGSVCSAAITRTNADSVYTFNANPTGFGTLTYQWSRNGLNISTAATPSLTLSTPGTYSICVTVTDAANCTATDCDTVIITPFVCNASLSHTNADSVYTFTASGTGTAPFSYAWSSNGTAISGGATAQQIIDLPGTYNVCVTITDANSCQSSDCEVITIAAPPVCSTVVSYTKTDTTYSFSTVNTGTGPFSYQWSNNGSNFSTAATPSISTNAAGNYNVCVTVTDANNCTATDCDVIVISSVVGFQKLVNTVFPNPATTHIQMLLSSDREQTAEFSAIDSKGAVLGERSLHFHYGKNLHNVQIGDWPAGTYTLRVTGGTINWTGRIVKE